MIPDRWRELPLRAFSNVLCNRARSAARKGNALKAARLAQRALHALPHNTTALNRLAKYICIGVDPNGEFEREHAGIDTLLAQIEESAFAQLREKYQNIVAFSLIRRRKPLPESLQLQLDRRDDDDALILIRLADDPDIDAHRLLSPLFERHDIPEPPLIADGTGIDRFGFPDCPPADGDKVTVAMTAFNAEKTIEHAIRSVVNQTWRNLEIIIVDDASSDGTGAIIEAQASSDARIVPLPNPSNMGTYASKNRALERATGRWFTCHDADDWSHPMKIQRQVEALSRYDALANTSRWMRLGCDFPARLAANGAFAHRNYSSLLFQTQPVRDTLGFFDSVKVSADAEMLARLQAAYGRRALLDEPAFLALGRAQAGTLTSAADLQVKFKSLSIDRKTYRESYRKWHRSSKAFYIPIKHEPRKFSAPETLMPSAN